MRSAARLAGAGVLLAGPSVLAFYSGGYFAQPRLVAGLVACLLLLLAAVASPRPIPASTAGRLALAGLAGLAAWVWISVTWAPLRGPAAEDGERVVLYAAALTAAAALLRGRTLARAAEPVMAAGITVTMAYGLSERLLPGVVELHRSLLAVGRLEQPLTYTNATGELAAIGFLLCTRIAGDPERRTPVRAAAAAAAVLLVLACSLTLSRGAFVAGGVGVVLLMLLVPTRTQLQAVAFTLPAGIVAALAASRFEWVASLDGSPSHGRAQGAAMLAILVVLMALAAALTVWRARRAPGATTDLVGSRQLRRLAVVAAVAAAAAFAISAAVERPPANPERGKNASAGRLRSLQSNRYGYWRVALSSFAHHPVVGKGSAGFRVDWLRERTRLDPAQDAHSLYIETLGELGLVGFALLLLFLGGVGACAWRAVALDRGLAAGPAVALASWAIHAGLDWDWEMPAVSLIAIVLAGLLIAAREELQAQPAGAVR